MADRVSIIRFKIDGIQGASSALDQFSRQVVSQQAIMERSAKATQQIQLGMALPGADLGKLQANLDKQQAIHAAAEQKVQQAISDVQFKASNDRFAVDRRLLDRTRDERIKQISAAVPAADRPPLIAAAEQIHQLATAEIAERKAAHDLAQAQAGPGAAKRQRAEEWAQVFASKDEARETAKQVAATEKRARIDEWANVFAGQDDARKSAREIAGAEKRARAEEWARVFGSQFPLRDRAARGGFARALRGVGGRMVLSHAAGTVGGDIIGDRHGGQEIGAIVGAFAFGGPAVGAAVAGLELIGAAFRAQRESAEAARKSAEDYGQTLVTMVGHWSGFATGLVNQSQFGDEMAKVMKEASAAANSAHSEFTKIGGEGLGISDWLTLTGPMPYVSALGGAATQVLAQEGLYKSAKDERDAEYEKHLADQRNVDEAQNRLGSLSTMAPGASRERAKLAAQLDLEKAQRDAAARERQDQAEAGLRQARSRAEVLGDFADNAPKNTRRERYEAQGLQYKADQAKKEVKEAEVATTQIKADAERIEEQASKNAESRQKGLEAHQSREVEAKLAAVDLDATAAIHAREHADLRIQGATEEQAVQIETAKYTIQGQQEAIKAAHARRQITQQTAEVALAMLGDLRSYNDESIAAAIKQSVEAKERAANEEEIAKQRVSSEQSALDILYQQHRITALQYEQSKAIAANRRAQENPAVADAVKTAVAAKEAAANSEAISRSRLSSEQSILDVLYEQHRINTLEYEQAKALAAERRAQAKEGNPEVAAALARSVAARDEAETVKDVMRYRVEKQQAELDLRVKRHKISERDADIERAVLADRRAQEPGEAGDRIRKEIVALADARQKLRDQEILDAGEFSTKYAYGHVDFRALNFNHPYGFYRASATDRGFADKAWTKTDFEKLNQDRQLEGTRTPAHQYGAGDIPSSISEWLARPVAEGGPKTETDRLLAEILQSLQRQEQGALN